MVDLSLPDEGAADFLLQRQASLLYNGFRSAAAGTVVASVCLVVALWGHLAADVLLTWLFSMNAVVALRSLHARRFRAIAAAPVDRQRLQRWIQLFAFGLVGAGLLWGAAGYWFIVGDDSGVVMLVPVFLLGVAASGSLLHASVTRMVAAFLPLVLLPLAARLYSVQGPVGPYLSGAVLAFLVLLLLASLRSHQLLRRIITIDRENEQLRLAVDLEKQEVEHAREEAELQYREIFDNMTDGLILLDVVDGRFRVVGANPAMEQMTGIPFSMVKGRFVDEVVVAGVANRAMANYQRCVDVGAPIRYEMSLPMPAGTVFFDSVLVPMRNADGRVYRLIGISRDITERKHLEEAIAIREREFRTLVENSPEIVVRYDRECRRVFTNPAYERQIGVPSSEVKGKGLDRYWRAENMPVADYIASLQRLLENGGTDECLLEWQDDKGALVSQIFHLVAEHDLEGRVEGVLAIGHNISALRQQEVLEQARMRILECLGQGGDLPEVLALVTAYLEKANPSFLCSIMVLDQAREQLLAGVAPNLPENYWRAIQGAWLGDALGSCGAAAWRGENVLIEDVAADAGCQQHCALALDNGLRACWSFPITDVAGSVLGVFGIFRRQPGLPSASQLDSIRQAHHLARLVIEHKQIEEKLKHQASYDTLTGLPNRRLFNGRLREEIAKASRNGSSLALLFIDLDRFKEVNDSLGHDTGDSLLIEAAARIGQCLRQSDVVARLGGDEFVAILPDIAEVSHLGRLAQSINDELAWPFTLGDHLVYVSASIGIACYPVDADNGEALLVAADQAMYAAKEVGRNAFCFFTSSMQSLAEQRLKLSNDLRLAIIEGQLALYYQPIVEVGTGRVVKAEALIRWQHPELGMVPPDQFIPLAEETGLIHRIGDWVFCEAARTAVEWVAMTPAAQISVNMSPRQFIKEGSEMDWLDYLRSIGLDTRHIVLEITEGVLLDERLHVAERLANIRASGMQISLDDFGTGYSAMAYLKKYPIDYLKIDRSFVRDLVTDAGDQAIAEAMITMAGKLGLKTIAEGVEDIEQVELLAAFDCDFIQGYYYAKPLPHDEFMAFVKSCGQPGADGK